MSKLTICTKPNDQVRTKEQKTIKETRDEFPVVKLSKTENNKQTIS